MLLEKINEPKVYIHNDNGIYCGKFGEGDNVKVICRNRVVVGNVKEISGYSFTIMTEDGCDEVVEYAEVKNILFL